MKKKRKFTDDDLQRLVEDWLAPLTLLALVIWFVLETSTLGG